ncbi:MAG: hypothetical protein JNL77_05555 [Nitrosomonas sp.]|nr:hypothetical protein [Nitrosomonas sp.]
MKANKKYLTCKIESAYGVDASPAVGTDDIQVENFKMKRNIRFVERNVARPFFGSQEFVATGQTFEMEFDIPITGAGGVADIPAWGLVNRICAMSQTLTPTTGPCTYAMISDAEESATIYFYWDGVRRKALGARGSISWRYQDGIAFKHYTIMALYGGVAEAALGGTPAYDALSPVPFNKANVIFELHGFAAVVQSLTIDQNNTLGYVNLPNREGVDVSDRKMTGQIVIECPKPTAKNFDAIIDAGILGNLDLTLGTVTGNKNIISADNVQLKDPDHQETEGIVMMSMGLVIRPTDAGNDEFTEATE